MSSEKRNIVTGLNGTPETRNTPSAGQLHQPEERYYKMVAEVEDYAILLLDLEGNIQNWNKGAERIKGYTAQEIIGRNFRLFYTAEDRQNQLPEQLLNQAAGEGKALHEGWRIRKDGSRFWGNIVITALHDDEGKVIGFSKVTRDLTERKKAEEALQRFADELSRKNEQLRQSEERYHKMVAEVEDYAILSLDLEGNIQNWNKGAERIKGYTAQEIIGRNFRLFYTAQDRQNQLPEQLLNQAAGEGKALHEGWRIRKDGSRFWGSIVITALHDEAGHVTGFSKMTRDLTERKKAEEILKAKNRQLQKMNEELLAFAFVAGHDLQEPLRKIQVFTDYILQADAANLSEQGKDFFGRILRSIQRMRALITDLLAYSRINSVESEFVPIDLNLLLKEITAEIRECSEEKKVRIDYGTLPVVSGISFQIHQLLTHLLTNSIKFSKKDTPLHIEIKAEILHSDQVTATGLIGAQEWYHLTFSDNGIGFSDEYGRKIFDVFQRLHPRSEYEGTGIGLAICKKVAENHGGLIVAEGKENEGACFHLYLPVLDPSDQRV